MLLTWIGGFVDAVGYISLYRVFVANMSGNSLAIGIGVATGHGELALRRGFAIPVFVVGLALSRLAIHIAARKGFRHVGAVTYGTAAVLLTIFLVVGNPLIGPGDRVRDVPLAMHMLLVALPAMAMGLQNATLAHFGPLTTRTTHVTGVLVEMMDHLSAWLVWVTARLRGRFWNIGRWRRVASASRRKHDLMMAGLLLLVWMGYASGAFVGAVLYLRLFLLALVVPIGGYALLVLVDLRAPLRPPRPSD